MKKPSDTGLSRRERQIMDILYRRGQATASEVMTDMPDPPTYSAVRALLRLLEEKGHAAHEEDGIRYIYRPTVSIEQAKKYALKHLLNTFFEGSTTQAVAALLDLPDARLSQKDLDRLARLIDQAKKEGR
jgi:predicted transcriptional regulator